MMEMFNFSMLVTLLSLSLTARAQDPNLSNITISKPQYQQLIKFPSASVIAGTGIAWGPTKKDQPAALFVWKGPPENFTMYFQISNIYKNTNLDNTGSYNWVVDGVPYSGKDYCIELRVQGKSAWSDYFELFNSDYPDPIGAPVPSIKNIGPYAAKATSKGKGGGAAAATGTEAAVPGSTDAGGAGNLGGSSAGSSSGAGSGDNKTSGGFTTAAFAGGIAGAVIGTALICSVIFLLISRRRRNNQQPPVATPYQAPPPPPPQQSQTPAPVYNAHQLEAKPYTPTGTPAAPVNNHYQPPASQLEANPYTPSQTPGSPQNHYQPPAAQLDANAYHQAAQLEANSYNPQAQNNPHRVELHGHGMQY